MSDRDEILKNLFPEKHASGLEAEYFFEDEENLPYEESHKDIIAYNGEFSYVNLGPTKLKELRTQYEQDETSVDPVALVLAERFMEKRCSSGFSAGLEPFRGENKELIQVDKLADCIDENRAEHIIPKQLSDIEYEEKEPDFNLIDFDVLTKG